MDDQISPRAPVNGIPQTWLHDEGARGQCAGCGRYTLEPGCFTAHPPKCACGSILGWRGTFPIPGPDAAWHGAAPLPAFVDLDTPIEMQMVPRQPNQTRK